MEGHHRPSAGIKLLTLGYIVCLLYIMKPQLIWHTPEADINLYLRVKQNLTTVYCIFIVILFFYLQKPFLKLHFRQR